MHCQTCPAQAHLSLPNLKGNVPWSNGQHLGHHRHCQTRRRIGDDEAVVLDPRLTNPSDDPKWAGIQQMVRQGHRHHHGVGMWNNGCCHCHHLHGRIHHGWSGLYGHGDATKRMEWIEYSDSGSKFAISIIQFFQGSI
jgi:hypothetical protein